PFDRDEPEPRSHSRRRPITGTKRPRPVLLPASDDDDDQVSTARRTVKPPRGSRSMAGQRRRIMARTSLSVVNPQIPLDESEPTQDTNQSAHAVVARKEGTSEKTGFGRMVEDTTSSSLHARPVARGVTADHLTSDSGRLASNLPRRRESSGVTA